ncbi:hypothetical protein F4553_002900 [Allocatelliglobosispora scoriae]|uniref:Uncharacterized protein n=1 Tax=Allocatelliglobosispora scoriae TaxID=643052 RepID=A0A841BRT8_9ACTN|nr:hypothetical protein [Allocatelliglobosispora scoriae]MBB5869521.1 hypothetical protein [Allocatelliglobosispora scoriae]
MPELRQEYVQFMESDKADVSWADAVDVRARGDRRRRNVAIATPAAAVLALAFAGGIVIAVNRDDHQQAGTRQLAHSTPTPSPSPSPKPSPSRTPAHVVTSADVAWIPTEALPPTAEMGRDLVVFDVKEAQPQPDTQDWIFAAEGCTAYTALNVRPASYLFKLSQKVRRAGPGVAGTGALEIRRYASADATQVLGGVRQVVEACPTYETRDPVLSTPERVMVSRRSYVVLSTGFAGDESLLMKGTVQPVTPAGEPLGDAVVSVLAVIRVDDLVTIVDLGLNDEARTMELAKKAAVRLCAATPVC